MYLFSKILPIWKPLWWDSSSFQILFKRRVFVRNPLRMETQPIIGLWRGWMWMQSQCFVLSSEIGNWIAVYRAWTHNEVELWETTVGAIRSWTRMCISHSKSVTLRHALHTYIYAHHALSIHLVFPYLSCRHSFQILLLSFVMYSQWYLHISQYIRIIWRLRHLYLYSLLLFMRFTLHMLTSQDGANARISRIVTPLCMFTFGWSLIA